MEGAKDRVPGTVHFPSVGSRDQIPFPWAPGRAGVHWAVRSPTRAAPCTELWLGPALLPATVSPISSHRRFLLFGAIGMIESIAAAKQDVVWVTPSFQQSKVLVFHCLQRDKPHNHRALQGPWGEPWVNEEPSMAASGTGIFNCMGGRGRGGAISHSHNPAQEEMASR